jgi:hypothetical protein
LVLRLKFGFGFGLELEGPSSYNIGIIYIRLFFMFYVNRLGLRKLTQVIIGIVSVILYLSQGQGSG